MKKALFLILTVALISSDAFGSDINFLTHSSEGQTYIDKSGELRGEKHAGTRAFYVELVRELMNRMKHSRKIVDVPFKRGFLIVQNKTNTALFNVSRTSKRENMFKWVGPILIERDHFYEMKNSPTGIKNLEDAKKVKSICVLNGSVHESVLRNNNFTNICTNNEYVNCFKMLISGRVNLTPSAGVRTKQLIQEGFEVDQIQKTPVVLMETAGYIAFSKNISDDIIQKWQTALDEIKESYKYQQLYDHFVLFANDKGERIRVKGLHF
ncbi:MAG: transporter substrate-binding domain-containing protein [Deltaproteobacteria bacterium]|nr:transporter substrate-binding domain-containing protein [Deltaproteobacteria bacterium]